MAENCGACRKQVKSHEQGIQCDLCQYWYHTNKCADVTKGLMEFLNSEDGQKSNVHWYCRACENTSKKLFEQMVLIEKRLSSFEKEVQKLGEKVDHLISKQPEHTSFEKEVQKLGEKVDSILSKQPVQTSIVPSVGQIARELEERDRRKCNIVVYGLKTEDESLVDDILKKIDSTIERAEKPIWLGKGERKPLLVKLKSEKDKWKVIASARTVTQQHFKGIFVNPDLTKSEREEQYMLRKELRERRANGEHVIIKRGAIVPCPKNG